MFRKKRTEGLNGNTVEEFLGLVREIKKETEIKENPKKLCNMDETGLRTNNCPEKMVTENEKKMRSRKNDQRRTWTGSESRWLLWCYWCVYSTNGHFQSVTGSGLSGWVNSANVKSPITFSRQRFQ
jgi:hypothetical protein